MKKYTYKSDWMKGIHQVQGVGAWTEYGKDETYARMVHQTLAGMVLCTNEYWEDYGGFLFKQYLDYTEQLFVLDMLELTSEHEKQAISILYRPLGSPAKEVRLWPDVLKEAHARDDYPKRIAAAIADIGDKTAVFVIRRGWEYNMGLECRSCGTLCVRGDNSHERLEFRGRFGFGIVPGKIGERSII